MNLARLVRRLVVLDIVLLVAGVALDSQLEGGLPENLRSYLSAQEETPLTVYDFVGVAAAVPVLAGICVG